MRDGITPSNGLARFQRQHPIGSVAPIWIGTTSAEIKMTVRLGRYHSTQGRHGMTKTLPDIDVRTDYTDPVRRLLSVGASPANGPAEWPDYAATYGLRSEHGTQLIRLACDAALYGSDPEGTAVWAPIHAWRALGQLRAAASVPALLNVLKSAGFDEDWTHTELPV